MGMADKDIFTAVFIRAPSLTSSALRLHIFCKQNRLHLRHALFFLLFHLMMSSLSPTKRGTLLYCQAAY